LRDSLQEEDDDGIQVTSGITAATTPEPEPEAEPVAEAKVEPVAEPELAPVPIAEPEPAPAVPTIEPVPVAQPEPLPAVPTIEYAPLTPSINTLVVDTEKSVGFTGMDSVFGDSGHAELRPMIEEGDNDLKIIGDSEDLELDDIEDLNMEENQAPAPLSADDYEAL
jgi:hypothetical protein